MNAEVPILAHLRAAARRARWTLSLRVQPSRLDRGEVEGRDRPDRRPVLNKRSAAVAGYLLAAASPAPVATRDSAIPRRPAAGSALTCFRTTSRSPSSLPRAGRPACWSSATRHIRPVASPASVHIPSLAQVRGPTRTCRSPAQDASSEPEVTPGDCLRPWSRPHNEAKRGPQEQPTPEGYGMAAMKLAAPERPGVPADRQRRARRMAYLGVPRLSATGYSSSSGHWAAQSGYAILRCCAPR